jgi:nitrogenase subunit NifH
LIQSFTQHLQEAKNTHITHLEDDIFLSGHEGAMNSIRFVREVVKSFSSNVNTQLNVSMKWDGCVHADTILVTDKGGIPIFQIVERMNNGEEFQVLAKDLNSTDNKNVMTPIIANNASNGEKNWVEITLENGETIKLTEDHEVHTSNRGWVKAGELTEQDDITETVK